MVKTELLEGQLLSEKTLAVIFKKWE